MRGIELRHLRCLVAIAEEGSFSRAAQRLGTTQPAISQLLKRLEDLLGHRLINRDGQPLSLTVAGEEVLRQARQALAAVETALDATERSLRGESGRLRIGLSAPSLFGIGPPIIRRFRAARPGVSVSMMVMPSPDHPAALLERRVDITFGTASRPQDFLDQRIIAEEELQVVLPRWHRLAGHTTLSLPMLREENWILPAPETLARLDVVQHCEAAGFSPRVVAESLDFLTAFGLVLADAGIALAGESFRHFAGPDLVMLPLDRQPPRLVHVLTYPAGEASPVVTAFLEVLDSA